MLHNNLYKVNGPYLLKEKRNVLLLSIRLILPIRLISLFNYDTVLCIQSWCLQSIYNIVCSAWETVMMDSQPQCKKWGFRTKEPQQQSPGQAEPWEENTVGRQRLHSAFPLSLLCSRLNGEGMVASWVECHQSEREILYCISQHSKLFYSGLKEEEDQEKERLYSWS